MPRLEHVVRAMNKKRDPTHEILEELKLMGDAIGLRKRITQFSTVVDGLASRMDKLEDALTGAVGGIKIPLYDQALDDVKTAISDLRAELADGLVPLAKGVSDTRTSVRNLPQPERVDLSPLHQEISELMGVISQISISVPDVVVESAPKQFVFDVKRKRSGLIDRVEVIEK